MFHEQLLSSSHEHHEHKDICHVVSVDMGYGHERPAHALRDLAFKRRIIVANNYHGIPQEDKALWTKSRKLYEFISRLKSLPFIGDPLFNVMDYFQEIPAFYPRRDLSKPSLQIKELYRLITREGLGRHLVAQLARFPVPFVSTFFIPAFAAEVHDYPHDIYLVVTDADISRAWAPMDPKKSRIRYFAPTGRVVERLQLYGVPRENIFLTGFPMSKSLIGGPKAEIIRKDLQVRLNILDPQRIFETRYAEGIFPHFGRQFRMKKLPRPLTLTFAVGGAGAQKTLGLEIMESLRHQLMRQQLRLVLVAGTRHDVYTYFIEGVKAVGLKKYLNKSVHILFAKTRPDYFRQFDALLRRTDILWTKPSELSFYTGIGLPIIMAPAVGSQEEFNRLWLTQVGGGISQFDPKYTNEWLFDWVKSGACARMAWNGFQEAPTHGIFRIEDILSGRKAEIDELPIIV